MVGRGDGAPFAQTERTAVGANGPSGFLALGGRFRMRLRLAAASRCAGGAGGAVVGRVVVC